jgi:endonuclease/exonuclease/phosphatase family metal-dependent hydrolase
LTATPPDFPLIQHGEAGRVTLERWSQNVGRPVALDCEPRPDTDAQRALVVLSWNVWIGRGRLGEMISRIQAGDLAHAGADPAVPLVVLLQEAYRSDSSIPLTSSGPAGRVLIAQLGQQEDVVETARRIRLNLRYAPSMRNGVLQSDRGNAILSTVPLSDARAIELPLVLQRRVAVSAAVKIGGSAIRLTSAHLDPRGPPGHRWLGAAGRARQAEHLVASIPDETAILGADLNLGRGRSEPAWRVLGEAGFTFGVPPTFPRWKHTFHALPRLVLDYLLVRDRRGVVERAHIHRLDEHPKDRGPRVFGSDHHPLLARLDLHPSNGESP